MRTKPQSNLFCLALALMALLLTLVGEGRPLGGLFERGKTAPPTELSLPILAGSGALADLNAFGVGKNSGKNNNNSKNHYLTPQFVYTLAASVYLPALSLCQSGSRLQRLCATPLFIVLRSLRL